MAAGPETCKTCERFRGGVCRADLGLPIDPRGKCPSWEPKGEPAKPTCPQHAALIDAIAMVLRAYPEIWFEQADRIARVLQETKKSNPAWGQLARDIRLLRKWVPEEHRRDFDRACGEAGA